jgi:hypothetical protein
MTTSISSRVVIAFSAVALAMSVATAAAQAGKSTDLLTDTQVKALVTTANTPADHVKLQKHFLAVAARYDAEAAEHADLAQSYRKPPVGRLMPGSYPKKAEHCDRLTQILRDAAKEARELAAEHGQMATAK